MVTKDPCEVLKNSGLDFKCLIASKGRLTQCLECPPMTNEDTPRTRTEGRGRGRPKLNGEGQGGILDVQTFRKENAMRINRKLNIYKELPYGAAFDLLKVYLNWKCENCLKSFEDDTFLLTLHHLTPRAKGGGTYLANLKLLCKKCHDETEGKI